MRLNPIIPILISLIINLLLLIYIIIFNKNKIEIVIVILLFLINLRPIIIKEEKSNLNILFVVDTSLSMNKKINNNTRLDIAKKDINYIIDRINNSNVSLIKYNNYSKVLIPYTYDYDYFKNTINNLHTIDKKFSKIESLAIPYQTIKNNIDNNTILIFMSCENKDTININNYSNIKKKLHNGIIIDYSNKSNNLKELSKILNIKYTNIKNKNLNKLIKIINKKEINETSSKYEFYYIFAIPLLILLIIDYNFFRRKIL